MAFLQNGLPIVGGGEPRYSIPADTTSGGWWTYNSGWKAYQHSTYSQGGTGASGFSIPNGVRKIYVDIDDFRLHENVTPSEIYGRIGFQLQNSSGVGLGGDVYGGGKGSYEGRFAMQSQRPPDGIGGFQPTTFGNNGTQSQSLDGSLVPLWFAGTAYEVSGGISLRSESIFHHYRIELTRLTVRSSGNFNNTSTARWGIKVNGHVGHGGGGGTANTYGGVSYTSSQIPQSYDYDLVLNGYCHEMTGGHVGGLLFRGIYNQAYRFEMSVEVSWEF